MGLSAKKKFLEKQPFCCLCGGSVRADTIEHAPPKALFINKQLPAKDHRVPACERCNNGSGKLDQVAAYVTLIGASAHRHDVPKKYVDKLRDGMKNNAPDAFRAMTAGDPKAEPFLLRVNGVLRKASETMADPKLFRDWLDPWVAKQAYALHYLRTGEIVPPSARVFVRFHSNAEIAQGHGPVDLIRALPNFGELRQGHISSEGQFSYKWGVNGENGCYLLYLQKSSAAETAVFRDASVAAELEQFGLFATNAEKGIHRLNLPQKTPANHGITPPVLLPG